MVWLKRLGIGIVAIVLLAIATLYGASQWIISTHHPVPLTTLRAATDPAAIVEGKRIAGIVQCRDCHGDAGKGEVFVDDLMIGHLAPPGIARKAALYSDAELERLIRHGVKRDGTGVLIMPAQELAHLSDQDVSRVIGWIRTLRPAPDDQVAPTRLGPLARAGLLSGEFKTNVVSARATPPADRGQYLVAVACRQCHLLHASQPSQSDGQIVPPLADVGAAYDLPAFMRLLHTGKGMSPRDLGAMRGAVEGGLHELHDDEIAAIHAYLVAEANAPAQ